MKAIRVTSAFVFLLAFGCSDKGSPTDPGNPEWVRQMIIQFQNSPVGNPPQSIWKYDYKGEKAYYIPPQCCDQFGLLYDSKGNLLCFPDGGFSGRGDGRCPDFFQERKNGMLIWRDARSS